MPIITLNGQEKFLDAATIPALLSSENVPQDQWNSLAVAQNGRVIPKSQWPDTVIAAGDTIEIVKPFVGG